jgi:hypothetical protein
MDAKQVAETFTELCKAGKFEEAGERFWADDVVSLEARDGPMSRTDGRDQTRAKGDWWSENNEVHGFTTVGPFVNGDQFALRFDIDVTPRGEGRRQLEEVGLYTVRDGKIVEERFFY